MSGFEKIEQEFKAMQEAKPVIDEAKNLCGEFFISIQQIDDKLKKIFDDAEYTDGYTKFKQALSDTLREVLPSGVIVDTTDNSSNGHLQKTDNSRIFIDAEGNYLIHFDRRRGKGKGSTATMWREALLAEFVEKAEIIQLNGSGYYIKVSQPYRPIKQLNFELTPDENKPGVTTHCDSESNEN